MFARPLAATWIAALLASAPLGAQTLAQLKDAYVDQGFGMFLHFNMGTFTGEEWASPSLAVNTFNPVGLDTDQWAAAATSAGMEYAVLTTKHHDGLALWNTSQSTYDVASTSWHAAEVTAGRNGDIVKRFADSFRAEGINVCLYYSIWDRSNGIDGTLSGTAATAYVKAELTELLTNYGFITCIWTDGWGWQGGYNYVDYAEVYAHIKTLSPNTLLVENNHAEGDGDIRTWEQALPTPGYSFPSETSATIRADNKWFFSPGADNLKSVGNVLGQRFTSNDRSATFLLDVTPNQSGQIPASQVAALAQIGAAGSASPVNWGPAFEIASAADLDLSGANIVAFNGGNSAATIGSTPFAAFTSPNFGALTAQPAGQLSSSTAPINSWAGDFGVYNVATGNADLDTLLDTHIYTNASVDMTTTLTGLQTGQWYRVQIIAPADSRTGTRDATIIMDGKRLIHRSADLNGDTVRHVSSSIGTFQATGSNLNIVTTGTSGGGWSAMIVSEISDPTGDPELLGASVNSITASNALALATLAGSAADVTLFWDTSDQGTGTWASSAPLGSQVTGPVTGTLTGLLPDTRYFYRFYAANTAADPDTTAWSAAGSSFASGLAGKAVTGVQATGTSKTAIVLTWTDNFTTETGFLIQRSPGGGGSVTNVATLTANSATFTDTGLVPGTTYDYQISALNGAGASDPSDTASASTLPPAPGIAVQSWFRMGDDGQGSNNRPADSSGNGRNFTGSINTATITATGGGYANDAFYSFNGVNQGYYEIGYDAPENNVGIEVWARTSDLAQANHHLFGTGSNVNGLNIGFDATNGGWFGAIGGVSFVGSVGVGNYTAGAWIHLALVRDHGLSTFYINAVASGTNGIAPNNATAPHLAVNAGGSPGGYFGGDLAEARIFTFTSGSFSTSDLLFPAVPEPSTAVLKGLLAGIPLLRRRRG
jgi:hypothetical protein